MAQGSKETYERKAVLTGGEIITLTLSELSALQELERRCFSKPWSMESLQAALTGTYRTLGWVSSEGTLAAFVIYRQVDAEVEILNVAVDPEYRRLGLAMQILEHIHANAREQQVATIHLEVGRSNHAAQALYKRLGYRQVGARRAYYQDPLDDALLFSLTLNK